MYIQSDYDNEPEYFQDAPERDFDTMRDDLELSNWEKLNIENQILGLPF